MEIQLQNLTKKFPNRNRKHPGDVIAVNEFNFTIPDGQLIGLLGPSGCGKSTTLNLICGLEKPTSGKIFFGGEDVTGVEPEHRSVGMVFQNYALYPHLTVRKNIMFPLENLKGKDRLSKEEMEKRVLDAAKMVSLEELLQKNPEICIVTNELGYGVVPIEPFDRKWREKTGRICTELAAKADSVTRVVCGIGILLKGEEKHD